MLVQALMTEDPRFVEPDTTLGEAIVKMLETGARHLPVVLGGKVVGMLSDRDLRPNGYAGLATTEELLQKLTESVASLMSEHVIFVTPDRDVADAVDLMLEYNINALPVVDGVSGKLVGIVSSFDVLKAARDLLWG